ncbi:cysteine desulfurase family protein [Alkalihalophilus marmarensis]|uniref:cysteine desulfurase family protein n=1 Tax=Alkalihalophilus marmarensis TaxID=521377 RepID=UPI002E22B1B8|nr:cysteine desulfurase family protein [Alkalihalophilus marmarensis]
MIYLDNSATTRPHQDVLETYTKVSYDYFGNPSSLHTLGMEAEGLLTKARSAIADQLHVSAKEILFTSGGTEGNNLAIKGTAYHKKSRGRHLITTEVEHASSYETYKELEADGFEVTYLSVDSNGRVSLEDVKKAIRKETILVSIIHVNNETGTIQPIEEIGQLLNHFPQVRFHVDDVQGITKVPLNIKKAKIDLLTASAHKFHGVRGTGMLYVRNGVRLKPQIHGGVQEMEVRSGTEHVAGAVAMARALRMEMEKAQKEKSHLVKLHSKLIHSLPTIDGVTINSPLEKSAPHIINFSVESIKPEVLIQSLSAKKIYVSTKSACSSKLAEPSRVLLAMGKNSTAAGSAIRVSLSYETTEKEIDVFLRELKKIIPTLVGVRK